METPRAPPQRRRTAISDILNPEDSSDEYERYAARNAPSRSLTTAVHAQGESALELGRNGSSSYQHQHPPLPKPPSREETQPVGRLRAANWDFSDRVPAPYPPNANEHPYSFPGTVPVSKPDPAPSQHYHTLPRILTSPSESSSNHIDGYVSRHGSRYESHIQYESSGSRLEGVRGPAVAKTVNTSPRLYHRDSRPESSHEPSTQAPYHHHYHHHAYSDTSSTAPPPGTFDGYQRTERASTRIAAKQLSREDDPQHRTYQRSDSTTSSHSTRPSPPQDVPMENTPISSLQIIQEQEQKTSGSESPRPSSYDSPQKRPNQVDPSDSAPAAKKARSMPVKKSTTKSPSSAAPSKRGVKRTEVLNVTDTTMGSNTPAVRELQYARCMSNRYKNEIYSKCVSCTRRWAGDTCRFQNIRYFVRNKEGRALGIAFTETERADAPQMQFPTQWNVPLDPKHIARTKITIARALLPILKAEARHINLKGSIHRARESDVRVTCDTCLTSLFSGTWMCRICGRETCAECFAKVKELTIRPDTTDEHVIAVWEAKRDKCSQSNPFFLNCNKRHEHTANHFLPVSRFSRSQLSRSISDMQKLLENDKDSDPSTPSTIPELTTSDTSPATTTLSTPPGDSPRLLYSGETTKGSSESLARRTYADKVEIPSHDMKVFTDAELTESVFRPIWARGEPVVVTGLLSKLKLAWTPEYFIKNYGNRGCLIIECQTETNKKCSVKDFFKEFGKYEERRERWKLKDWPPTLDFKSAFPELYEDFSNAVPVPTYVRRDGALNIASHFPLNTVSPDLGPKMYNAMASSTESGSKGSTRLHMDMADAVNLMTYASPKPDGTEGCAAWDLFRAEDSDKIRTFIRQKVPHLAPSSSTMNGSSSSSSAANRPAASPSVGVNTGRPSANSIAATVQHDPIHSQQIYLDDRLRKELWDTMGVKSFRFYQRPGEAVFIPAGCAHQVCNLADCVKIAIDFVSPENISRCEKLTREFREQNQSMAWKEDVLQLRTMMWFAWLSCTKAEEQQQGSVAATAGGDAAHGGNPLPVVRS